MRTWLHFDTMVTPKIITFIYWLMLAGAVITGLMMLSRGIGAMRYSGFAGFGMVVCAPLVAALIALFARIYCELMIVLFKMNEALQEIRRK
jgi:hypothetical protein